MRGRPARCENEEVTSGPEEGSPRGIVAAARDALVQLATLVQLERELAQRELRRKGAAFGAGIGAATVALLLVPLAIGFGLATVAAALALAVATWLALLIVFGVLLLLLVLLAGAAIALLRRASPLKPERALEEARLTQQLLRNLDRG